MNLANLAISITAVGILALAKLTGWTISEIEDMPLDELVYWLEKASAFQERINSAME